MGFDRFRLRLLRKNKMLSQQQICDLLGIALGTYRNWEQGAREPDTETVIKLASFFQVSTDYLFGMNVIGNNNNEVTAQSLKDDEKVLLSTWRELRNGDKEFIRRQMELLKKERDQQRGDD